MPKCPLCASSIHFPILGVVQNPYKFILVPHFVVHIWIGGALFLPVNKLVYSTQIWQAVKKFSLVVLAHVSPDISGPNSGPSTSTRNLSPVTLHYFGCHKTDIALSTSSQSIIIHIILIFCCSTAEQQWK